MAMTVDRVATELTSIGIETIETPDARGFLEDVRIHEGRILYRPGARVSNILHEAGHLACIPPMFRKQASDDLDDIAMAMCDYAEARMAHTHDPEEPLLRAIMQCSDTEATAWAWAFGRHLGLDPEEIIEDQDYDGAGEHVRLQVSTGMHLGIHGLRAAGMIGSVRDWPRLSKWLQDAEEGETNAS